MEAPKSPSKAKISSTRYKLALKTGFWIGLAGLFLLSGLYYVFKHGKSRNIGESYFTVVVDCGSTGSRVNVYEWMLRSANGWELPVLVHSYPDDLVKNHALNNSCLYHCLQTEPGLDKFVGNASGVQASLEPLMNWAKQWVPEEKHKETPIFVLATAGLRRLAIQDVRMVLDDVEAVVKKHEFVWKRSWMRVLTGKEEAYYGWVALNYVMGRLGNRSSLPTFGLLDLGGSSLQVAAEANKAVDDELLVGLKIGHTEHRIMAYSLPAYGLHEAFDRTFLMLRQKAALSGITDGNYILKNACMNSNYAHNYTCYDCTGRNMSDEVFLGSSKQKRAVSLMSVVGDPNWEECKILARAAATNLSGSIHYFQIAVSNRKGGLFSEHWSEMQNLTAVVAPDTTFHALSGFFVVYNKLKLSPKANFTQVMDKGRQLCSESWFQLSHVTESGNYGEQFCFQVPYMASLIGEVLHLGNREILFGPGDISWSLGAALVEGGFIQLRSPRAEMTVSLFRTMGSIPSPVFLFVLLLCLGAIIYWRQIKLPTPQKKGATGVSLPLFNSKCQQN